MTQDGPPPQPVSGAKPSKIDIAGYVLPTLANDAAVLINMPGTDDLFLPIFKTADLLQSTCYGKIPFKKIKQIKNHHEFLDSIPIEVRVIIDLRPHDDPVKRAQGMTRFTEIFR